MGKCTADGEPFAGSVLSEALLRSEELLTLWTYSFNPLTAPARKYSGQKNAHIQACKQPIWWSCNNDGPITNLLSVLRISIEVPSRAHAKRGKSRNNFKYGTSVGRFWSESAASMAVRGLKQPAFWTHFKELASTCSFKGAGLHTLLSGTNLLYTLLYDINLLYTLL